MAINEIIHYNPAFNLIPLSHLAPSEMNLLFSILAKMKQQHSETIRFDFYDLRELSEYKDKNKKKFLLILKNLQKKTKKLTFKQHEIKLFSKYFINETDTISLNVQLNQEALHLFNDLDRWIRFSLHEFISIKSRYAKTLFRLLKEFRTTGYVIITKDKFHYLLDVPLSYRESNINETIIKPAKEQLIPFFKNLNITKKHYNSSGYPIKSYIFTFLPEPKNKDDFQVKRVSSKIHNHHFDKNNNRINYEYKQKLENILQEI